MLTEKETKFIELQRKEQKSFFIIIFMSVIFVALMVPLMVKGMDLVKVYLSILVGGGIGMRVENYLISRKWLNIIEKLQKEQ